MRKPVQYAHKGDRLTVPVTLLAERLWPNIDRSGGPDACWPWLAAAAGKPPHQRGILHVNRQQDYAHYWVWRLLHPSQPRPGYLGKTCTTELCCNPAHHVIDGAPRNCRLTASQFAQIQQLLAQDRKTQAAIARQFGVTQQLVSLIAHGYRPRALQ